MNQKTWGIDQLLPSISCLLKEGERRGGRGPAGQAYGPYLFNFTVCNNVLINSSATIITINLNHHYGQPNVNQQTKISNEVEDTVTNKKYVEQGKESAEIEQDEIEDGLDKSE